MKKLILTFAIACQSSAAMALPCEGSRLAVTVAGWSVTAKTADKYSIDIDLEGEIDPINNVNGRIYFIDKSGNVISSTKINRHLHIDPGSWTKQTIKSNDARWRQLAKMNHADVSASTCVHSASFEDGTSQAF